MRVYEVIRTYADDHEESLGLYADFTAAVDYVASLVADHYVGYYDDDNIACIVYAICLWRDDAPEHWERERGDFGIRCRELIL